MSSVGRSSATTILSLSAIRLLKASAFSSNVHKLLSFTDNRQDASLQAGHFNDFIEVSLLRGAIYSAVAGAGAEGLRHDQITQKVFDSLDLPLRLFSPNPDLRFYELDEAKRALRQVLGYRLYRDLRRGWRIALPNLEQCGLLRIDYLALDDVCRAEDIWAGSHPALVQAAPATRIKIAHILLDHLRRELAIKVDYLDRNFQERIQQMSSQYLQEPWALDENEYDSMERGSIALPRARRGDERRGGYTYISARGAFGIYLRSRRAFDDYGGAIKLAETQQIIHDLFVGLRAAGLVEIVLHPRTEGDVPGYQLKAAAMRWRAGDGAAFHDALRVAIHAEDAGGPNPYFVDFYRGVAKTLAEFRAREHTAQAPSEERQAREQAFREGALPILYCSPTMELGVDIAELNVVNMRNVPPTPANYAQRSGRAGRSGQPALIFTYCAGGSPHDQYFFRRAERMVAGAVVPPRLDLTNPDLLQAHIHAIWLAEANLSLGKSLTDILDVDGEEPSLALLPGVRQQIESGAAREAARHRAAQFLRSIDGLGDADGLLDLTMNSIANRFDAACDRWRGLYRSALEQVKAQEKIRRDQSRPQRDKQQAERLRREALSQLDLLSNVDTVAQSDFYSYRYFATEGFLPGYSFPRLPLSAYIPARRTRQADSYLSRPRFLAISEFGPRAIVYHEGSRYIINKVTMPVGEDGADPLTSHIKQCGHCGYMHTIGADGDFDLCERCGELLAPPLTSLLRMQNVSTKRRDRISADEEERLRFGYELRTGLRFDTKGGEAVVDTALVRCGDADIARLTYAPTATVWRINLGWRRRKNKEQYGFLLDIERGFWSRNENDSGDRDDPLSDSRRRVIPYVQDSRNCLLVEPLLELTTAQMASLQAALKRAIETQFQLEENELAAEPLPDSDSRRQLLFFEAAEGGAGVLRQLLNDPRALRTVAREALEICHFDCETGADRGRAQGANENCEAACYDCLLSYGNQREHDLLDRKCIQDLLLSLRDSVTVASPVRRSREEHLSRLLRRCDSDLERKWLRALEGKGLRLPDKAQPLLAECRTRPDFLYERAGTRAAIYIDGAQHDHPENQARDQAISECLDDIGYRVIRFSYRDDWDLIFSRYAYIFGAEA